MKYFTTLFILLGLVSCSGSKSVTEDESIDAGIELADAVEFSDESEDIMAETIPEDFANSEVAVQEEPAFIQEQPVQEPVIADNSAVEITPTAGIGTYTVKENETLMMIAFNLYGDYAKWKEIAQMNSDVLNGNQVAVGTELKYNMPAEPFIFNPSGNPYLVKQGDYLGKVSHNTYGTSKHWKAIWDNNKPLIKDPNVIFAGFTIYTPILQARDVAFEDI
ncbi:MAG: hypothetical protein CME67_06315 [Halobacteriovoraceae bacterium]|nr:hypothetical protein [Peredibacter sp.]MBJ00831.1 hypothetical protein [Halobacteriovoraceae bacterium]|tara:strand:- start:6531 stop:7190 length:660 start_codon:yes stop_codon:yes gene_type:complete